jgi:hypothetical protein
MGSPHSRFSLEQTRLFLGAKLSISDGFLREAYLKKPLHMKRNFQAINFFRPQRKFPKPP